jgi:hypothetical protein
MWMRDATHAGMPVLNKLRMKQKSSAKPNVEA